MCEHFDIPCYLLKRPFHTVQPDRSSAPSSVDWTVDWTLDEHLKAAVLAAFSNFGIKIGLLGFSNDHCPWEERMEALPNFTTNYQLRTAHICYLTMPAGQASKPSSAGGSA